MKTRIRIYGLLASLFLLMTISGCATLKEVAALRRVDFSLDRLSEPSLAGVALKEVRSYQDLSFIDVGRLGLAIANRDVPLTFVVHVRAENPPDNAVTARLIGMSWTLLLQDKETISGTVDQPIVLPPGEPQDVPITVALNLVEFFDGGVRDLVDLALSFAGREGEAQNIKLQMTPTIDTPLGPIPYPQPITVMNRTVGS